MDIRYILQNMKESIGTFKNPISLFLLNRMISMNRQIETIDGTKLRFNNFMDIYIIYEIFCDKPYTPQGFEISPDDVVIDIGANAGYFSLYAAKRAKQVYSYEPEHINFAALMQNIRLNGAKNIFAYNVAVSGRNETITLSVGGDSAGGHSIIPLTDTYFSVPATSLEAIFNRNSIDRCNLLKIDCEGAEYDILLHTPPEIFQRIDKISMEAHYFDGWGKYYYLLKFLKSMGYEIQTKDQIDVCKMVYCRRV